MATKKKSKYDDLTPWGNLPSASIYGSKKSKTPGGERRWARGKTPTTKKKVAYKKTISLKSK